MSAVKYPLVRIRRDDLTDEKIVALLVVRLGDTLANEPCGASRDQRYAELLFIKISTFFILSALSKRELFSVPSSLTSSA